ASKFVADNTAVRGGIVRGGLLNNALWWFRWGAMLTFITGWLYIFYVAFHLFGGPREFATTAYGWKIFFGGMLGTTMWANVWFVIWPAQQVVMRSADQVATGGQAIPEAAPRGARSGLASRTNTMLSIPMLFFMGAAKHLQMANPASGGQKWGALILLAVVIVIVEVNALVGQPAPPTGGKKILSTLNGTFWGGFIIAIVMYLILAKLFG
ncbi:MAG TPA: urate hydroxylase PuuD, partial [Methylomirabilota bacterium]|nr:urate hydroxylase PuuD [Methylomirabilota bacterium]